MECVVSSLIINGGVRCFFLIIVGRRAIIVVSSLIIGGGVRCFFFNYCWWSALFLL